MKLNIAFSKLEKLVRDMGASPVAWRSGANRLGELNIESLLLEGIETHDLNDVDVTEEGLLTYKGKGVLLYIKDTGVSKETNEKFPENSKKFHFSDCKTLENMKKKGKYEKYVLTTDKSGSFKVDYYEQYTNEYGETKARLKVCKNCLNKINYNNYLKNKEMVFDNFSIKEFFEKHHSNFKQKPKYTDKDAPPSGYTSDWNKISRKEKHLSNWTCKQCKVNLSAHRHCLHTHHKNSVKYDNNQANLEVLCQLCHAEHHNHMKPYIRVVNTIRRLRKEQGLS